MVALATVDMALWDIKAKAAEMPVYKLLGGYRDRVPCYVAGGYYREGKSVGMLARECKRYADEGFTGIKMRVGGASLEEDLERVKAVREAVGPDVRLMLDANGAYDVESAVRAAQAYATQDIFWFEEPVHWYDEVDGLRLVTDATGIPIATGEHARTRWQARQLLTNSNIRYMQYDGMMSGGPTEWLKVAGMCSAFNIPMAPHHGPNIHAHLVAAVPNGLYVEYFPNPADYETEEDLYPVRYDLMREAFSVFPEVIDGDMVLSDTPGWGFELDEYVVARRSVPW
jgi:L-alanine-DL-glutamate epimerase-like enolase superfamily enzyme